MLAEAPDRRRIFLTAAAGIGVEAAVVATVWATGSVHHLAGVPSSIGITAAIVCGLLGGRVSGGVVGIVNAVMFLALAASSGNDVSLGGVPTVVLWFAIGFGTGAAADYLRGRLDRAFSELQRANESAEFVASSLQRSLLPERLPEIPGVEIGTWFRPAGDGSIVGGDFFDVWRVTPDRFGAAIGDVCGKGPTAAAVTALARHTMRTASMLDQSPADTLRVVNDAVRRRVSAGQFCTALAVAGQSHPEGFEITVACGGHPRRSWCAPRDNTKPLEGRARYSVYGRRSTSVSVARCCAPAIRWCCGPTASPIAAEPVTDSARIDSNR
jgi:Stage II sporulation protein E (SpoIIE)